MEASSLDGASSVLMTLLVSLKVDLAPEVALVQGDAPDLEADLEAVVAPEGLALDHQRSLAPAPLKDQGQNRQESLDLSQDLGRSQDRSPDQSRDLNPNLHRAPSPGQNLVLSLDLNRDQSLARSHQSMNHLANLLRDPQKEWINQKNDD